jgi:long-chain fatty acid transport protein
MILERNSFAASIFFCIFLDMCVYHYIGQYHTGHPLWSMVETINEGFMRSKIYFWLATLPLAASALISSDLWAFKELALGDSGVAHPISSIGPRYNPAVIAELGERWDISQGIVYQNSHVTIQRSDIPAYNQSASATQAKWYPVGIFGYTKQLTPTIVVGISTDGTRSFKGSISRGLNAFGRGRLGGDVTNGIFLSTVAWKPNKCHSFGFSVPIYVGRVKFNGFQNLADASPPLSVSPNNVTNRGYDWAVGVGLRFGWLWHVTPELNLGVSYTSKLVASTSFHKYRGFLTNRGKLDNPPNVRAGAAYTMGAATFIAESQWNFYKEARSTGNPVDSPALAGSKNASGLGWPTVATVTLAAEYHLSEFLTVRGGWSRFVPVVVNKNNVIANFLAPFFITKQVFTLGATYDYCGYELSGTLFYPLPREVHGKPSLALANGTMDVDSKVPTIQLYLEIGRRF